MDDAISCTNTNGSSLSDREKDIADDLDDESSLTSAVHTPVKHNVGPLPIDFDVEKICEPGTTLLWDIIQNQSLVRGWFYYFTLLLRLITVTKSNYWWVTACIASYSYLLNADVHCNYYFLTNIKSILMNLLQLFFFSLIGRRLNFPISS